MKTVIAFLLLIIYSQAQSQPIGWDTPTLRLVADSLKRSPMVFDRVNFFGVGSAPALIVDIHCSGIEAGEFVIIANQNGYYPFGNFPVAPGDSIWVDVAFKPNYNKEQPDLFADRHATLEALYYTDAAHTKQESVKMNLIGTFGRTSSSIVQKSALVLQAVVQGGNIIVTPTSSMTGKLECGLYDLLGRKIAVWNNNEMVSSQLILPLPTLNSGFYFLRVADIGVPLQIRM